MLSRKELKALAYSLVFVSGMVAYPFLSAALVERAREERVQRSTLASRRWLELHRFHHDNDAQTGCRPVAGGVECEVGTQKLFCTGESSSPFECHLVNGDSGRP